MNNKYFDLNSILKVLDIDSKKNIDIIVKEAFDFINGSFSIYNRFDEENDLLYIPSSYNLPDDFIKSDKPHGYICFEKIIQGNGTAEIIKNIEDTQYYETDITVKKYNLKSYAGCPVFLDEKIIGSLSIYDKQEREFTNTEINILFLLSRLLSLEENKFDANKKLHESISRFRSLIEMTSDWVWEIDTDATYTYSNPNVLDILGYKPEHIVGMSIFDFINEENFKNVKQMINEGMKHPKAFDRFENIQNHRDNRKVIIETSGVPIYDMNGKLSGYRGINRDVTKGKDMEDALLYNKNLFQKILNDQTDLICRSTSGGEINYVNNAYCNYFNISYEDLIGTKFLPDIPKEDGEKLMEHLASLKENKSAGTIEHRVIINGNTRWLSWTNRAIVDASENFREFQSVGRDITIQKQAESDREKLILELKQALKDINTLKGLIPICANCKKIRDDKGYWNRIESYIESHSEAMFSHGICPDCADALYKNQKWYRK